jgi:phenylacetate-CoA ligase
MTLKAETPPASDTLREEIVATLRAVTKLGGNVEQVDPGRAAERRAR